MASVEIPVEYMFSITLQGLRAHAFDYVGPFGRRLFQKAVSGQVDGPRFKGRVLPFHASDYGRLSTDGSIRHLEFDLGIEEEDGTVVLMHYRGRMSPRYGAGGSRLQATFEVAAGKHGWLNEYQCVGVGEERGDETVLHIYALTGAAPIEGGAPSSAAAPAQRSSLPAEFILTRKSEHVTGARRYTVVSPLGGRYFTLAEGGGKFTGPKLGGEFVSGYSWSPHRTDVRDAAGDGMPGPDSLWRYDVKTLLREEDGTPILMSYTGTGAPAYGAGAWMTATLFETAEGRNGWLNQVQGVGYGRWAGDGAHYTVYALD